MLRNLEQQQAAMRERHAIAARPPQEITVLCVSEQEAGKPSGYSRRQLLTLNKSVEYSGIPYGTLRRLVLQGHLPAVKLPGRRGRFIDPVDLDDLIEASKTGTVAGTKLTVPQAKIGRNGKLKPYPNDWYKTR